MASIELDLNLFTPDTWEISRPGTPERAAALRVSLDESGARNVRQEVVNEHGPAGGAQVVRFEGPRDEIEKIVRWAVEGMNEDWSWADEYWLDRS